MNLKITLNQGREPPKKSPSPFKEFSHQNSVHMSISRKEKDPGGLTGQKQEDFGPKEGKPKECAWVSNLKPFHVNPAYDWVPEAEDSDEIENRDKAPERSDNNGSLVKSQGGISVQSILKKPGRSSGRSNSSQRKVRFDVDIPKNSKFNKTNA